MTARGWVRHSLGDFVLDTQWSAEPGTVTVLYGPSGAGKSLTLRAIAGLVRPQQGRIELDGETVFDHETGVWTPPHRRGVGFLPQEYGLFPHLTVSGNIGYGLRGPDGARRVAELVRTLHLEGLDERRTWELSGGQRQRVALARALAIRPRALLLDEPFAALDPELRRAVRQEVRDVLTSSHVPVILVTHDAEEALALADRVQIIDGGKTVAEGDPLTMLRQPAVPRIARLAGVENVLSLRVHRIEQRDGSMVCRVGQSDVFLETPLAEAAEGDDVTIGVRATDIILAREAPHGLSARNTLAGTVESVVSRAPGYDVTLACGAGLRLVSHVTRHAVQDLGITPGAPLWAVIKASSCYVLAGE